MMTWIEFISQLIIFAGLSFFLVYRPGAIVVSRIFPQLPALDKIIISYILGIVFFVLLQFYLGHLGWLHAWPIVVGIGLVLVLGQATFSIKKWLPNVMNFWQGIKLHWLLLMIVLIVALLQGSLHFFSGWTTEQGLILHAFHATDAPLHLSCIDQLTWRFPPHQPGFSGAVWHNYHYLSDLFWAGFKRLYPRLDTMHLYFRIAPFLYSCLISFTMYSLIRKITKKISLALTGVILNGLTGGFGYLLPLMTNQTYPIWESIFWLSPTFSLLFNPGVATSYFLILAGCRLLLEIPKILTKGTLIIIALMLGSIIGFKVFGGLLVLGGLLVVGCWQLILKKQLEWLLLFGLTFIVSLSLYLPNNTGGDALISFLPGYTLITMIASPDRMALLPFNLLKSWMMTKPWLLVSLMAVALPIFIIGNLGVKSIGIITFIKSLKKWKQVSPIMILITSICIASLTLPLLIGQFGVNWQPIQFGYYAVLLMTIPAVIQLDHWFKPCSSLQIKIIWIMIMILGLPCIIHSLIVIRWGSEITPPELEAYQFLQNHTSYQSVILRPLIPTQRDQAGKNRLEKVIAHGEIMSLDDIKARVKETNYVSGQLLKPALLSGSRQHLRKVDSAFVAAFSKRNSYLEDITTAQSMGFNYQPRLELMNNLLNMENSSDMKKALHAQQINYLILFDRDQLQVDLDHAGLNEVFHNNLVKIYQVE